MKSSNIGGQAVIEGVMMKNGDNYAVAVRKPDNEIEVKIETYKSFVKSKKLRKTPIIRGVLNFVDSMILGMATLTFSASFYEEDEAAPADEAKTETPQKKNEFRDKLIMGLTVALSVVLALGIFMGLPYAASALIQRVITSNTAILIIEGLIRMAIFIGYVCAISLMEDIRRVYMYHGAEHKCINCIEHGRELNVDNVRDSSKQHKRCGTSFMFIVFFAVMLVNIIVFSIFTVESVWLKMLIRLLLIPVIAGFSYEFIRLAGRSDNTIVNALSKPGLMMQELTTKEPEDDMIEVAIRSVEAVFNWKEYLNENFGTDYKTEPPETAEVPVSEELVNDPA